VSGFSYLPLKSVGYCFGCYGCSWSFQSLFLSVARVSEASLTSLALLLKWGTSGISLNVLHVQQVLFMLAYQNSSFYQSCELWYLLSLQRSLMAVSYWVMWNFIPCTAHFSIQLKTWRKFMQISGALFLCGPSCWHSVTDSLNSNLCLCDVMTSPCYAWVSLLCPTPKICL
jgi:hypothetical protein